MLIGIAGIALLWPDIMKRELPWVIAALGAFFAVIVYGFLRLGRAPCYHTWAADQRALGAPELLDFGDTRIDFSRWCLSGQDAS